MLIKSIGLRYALKSFSLEPADFQRSEFRFRDFENDLKMQASILSRILFQNWLKSTTALREHCENVIESDLQIQACTEFEPMTSAIPVQCSTN